VSVDQAQEDESRDALMLEDVKDFRVRFFNDQQNWQDSWPDDSSLADQVPGQKPEVAFPSGLEVVIEHERFGKLTRTFVLPDFDSDVAQNRINTGSGAEAEEGGESASEPAGGGVGG